MYNPNIFKILVVSLLMCPMLSPAMEMPINAQNMMLLSVANQSEQAVQAFITDPVTIQPYEDKDDYVISTINQPVILTSLGMFTLTLDNIDHPTSFLLIFTSPKDEQIIILQKVPYNEVNNIILIVNPDGAVSIAQGNTEHAIEKINAIQQNIVLPLAKNKKPKARVAHFAQDKVTINFDQPVTDAFVDQFNMKLNQLSNQVLQGLTRILPQKTRFFMKVSPEMTKAELQNLLDKINK